MSLRKASKVQQVTPPTPQVPQSESEYFIDPTEETVHQYQVSVETSCRRKQVFMMF